MKIRPIFQRIFIESVKEMPSATPLFIPMKGFRDRGRVYGGDSKLVKKGDLIKYSLRGSRDLKFGELELVSINESDLELLIKEDEMGVSEIQPLTDRILVQVDDPVETLASGLILPDISREKPQQGTILAVGQGRVTDDGKTIPMVTKEGDKVLFPKGSGSLVHDKNGKELLILREDDILATVK